MPITSIVVAICVLAAVLIVMTMRDVDRGRSHVLDALDRKAMGMLTFLRTDLRTELISPIWQPERLQLFAQEVANRANLTYLALVAEDGRVLVHSDPAVVGTVLDGWQPDVSELPRRHLDRRRTTVGLADGTVVEVEEYAARVDVNPQRLCSPAPLRLGRHARMMPRPSGTPSIVAQRLSQLFGEPVVETDELIVYAVVALDPTDLESVFFASRDRALVLAGALLVIGAAAIYFLFVAISYRSTRTALANMRSYTNNVIESMASGLISVDHASRVVRVNSRARELFDLGTRDMRGEAIEDVVRFEKSDARDDIRDVLAGERRVAEAEIGIETREGRIPVEISASLLLDEDGTRTGAVLLFQDLRELEALKAAVERERHLAALGRLAAGVAHEVRNPLSSLKGFAQFLRSKFNPGSEEERYSNIMIEEVERLDRVVQELLDFAKPVTADRTESGVNDIINDALSLVSEDATFRGVEVVTELGDGLPPVLVDARQLRQALLNVLLNGIDAMRDGGRLTVRTALRAGDTPQVVIEVVDTGVGMTEEEQDKLFEPFYTTKPGGTVLGPTHVSRLIEQNRGHIGLRSDPGEGTVFSISFPAVVGCSGDVGDTDGRSANGRDDQEPQSEE
ncbi:PAS domain-containing protein [bacterium]|nr:PAS domain-containing protein [bacterium]